MLAFDLSDLDNRDIERTATEVIHGDLAVTTLLVHAIGQGGGSRFVDDAFDVEAGNASGILGCLPL